MTKETRVAGSIAAAGEGEAARTLKGYAVVFGMETTIAGCFIESIAEGAFSACLAARPDVRALFNHVSSEILGRTLSGTLRLAEDAKGLACEIDLPDTTMGRDLATLVARGDISQMSFGFDVTHDEWIEPNDPAGLPRRIIRAAELFDVSPVTFPAYEDTECGFRSRDEARAIIPDFSAKARAETETLRLRIQLAEASRPRNAA